MSNYNQHYAWRCTWSLQAPGSESNIIVNGMVDSAVHPKWGVQAKFTDDPVLFCLCQALVLSDKQPKTFAQAGISHQDEAKINCSKPPGGNHIRDLILSFDKGRFVLHVVVLQ